MVKEDVVIVSARRTPVGDFGGSFRTVSSLELGRIAVEAAVRQAGLAPKQIDEVIFGNCNQYTDEPNVARCIALLQGCRWRQRFHYSAAVCLGDAGYRFGIPGDHLLRHRDSCCRRVESMSTGSLSPQGGPLGKRLQHGEMTDSLWEMLMDPIYKVMMGRQRSGWPINTALPEAQDEIVYRSHINAIAAIDGGRFKEEIVR